MDISYDVMVGTETEEEHDDIVEKILRKIAENDLFVKLEKYIWKIREFGFFRSSDKTRWSEDGK